MSSTEKLVRNLKILAFIVGLIILGYSIYLVVKDPGEGSRPDPKVFWYFLNFVFLIVFIYFLTKAFPYRPHLHSKGKAAVKKSLTEDEQAVFEHWRSIRNKAFSGKRDQMEQAILEADKVIDEALEKVGFTGETTEEKIRGILSDELGWVRGALLKANEYRNKLVHDPHFKIDAEDVKKTIHNYEVLLKELDLVDPSQF